MQDATIDFDADTVVDSRTRLLATGSGDDGHGHGHDHDHDHDEDDSDDFFTPLTPHTPPHLSVKPASLLSGLEHEFVVANSPTSPERVPNTPITGRTAEDSIKSSKSPWWRTPSVYWLLPPFSLYCMAMGAVSVPKLNVFLALICRQYGFADTGLNGHEDPKCHVAGVQSLLARFTLYAHLISGTLCAVTSPKLGAMSDRYGRKPIMAITAMGMLMGDIITITAASFPDTISVYWILLEYALGGLAGAFIATLAIVLAYASDCTPPARRSVVFGWIHGCYYAGIAIGPVLGASIIKALHNILSIFYVAFACHLTFILSALFLIPESLSHQQQQAAKETYQRHQQNKTWVAKVNPLKLLAPLKILRPPREQAPRPVRTNMILLSAIDTIVFGVPLGSASIVVIYSEYIFGWGNFEASVFVSITNTCRVGMLLLVLPLIFRIFSRHQNHEEPQPPHPPEPHTADSDSLNISIIRTAVLFDIVGYLGYASVTTGVLFTISGVIASIGGIASPTLQSTLTNHVPGDRTGQLFGAIALLHALSRILAPMAFHLIYSVTVGNVPQLVFWCLALTFGVAFGAAWGIRPRM